MKKLTAFLLAVFCILSLAACKDTAEEPKDTSDKPTNVTVDDAQTTAGETETAGASNALELLTAVWNSYGEDDKFPVAGGDLSEENMSMEGPGKFGLDDADALDTTLGFPAASVDQIVDAASLVHMMNANTFTCGAYHIKSADDMEALTAAIKDHIMQRQWLCGFPEKLVIVTVDDYIVSFFGEGTFVDTFKTNLTTAYSSAQVVCDEPIA